MKTPIRSSLFISFLVVVLVAAWSGIPAARASQSVKYIEAQQTGLITVNDFNNYRVFQRDIGGSSKSITISGTYSDMTWDHVEARILQNGTDTPVVDWTTIDTTVGGGSFSGALTVPQGGWYNVEVRALDGSGSMLGSSSGTNKWGVGMIILVIGQSNMSGRGKTPYTTAASDLAVNYSNAGIWEHLADPYDDDSPTGAVDYDNDNAAGSMIPAIANILIPVFNIPIAFVPSPKGGSNLWVNGSNYGWAYRNSSNHFDTSTLYGQSITKAQSVGGVELIIMHQGEQDLNDRRTQANYEADSGTMIGHYRQDLYASIPIFICQLGTVGAGTNSGVVGIRSAQHDLDNGTNIFMGATAMDQARFDIWHYDTPGLNVIGSRLANAILYYFGQSSYYRGPSIASASFSDGNRNQVMVLLNHHGGTDITPSTGITGFDVLDNGSTVTITSATRYAANAIQLTLSASISSSHTATLRYLYGMTPVVSGLVKDNSPLALPLENTTSDLTFTPTNTPTFADVPYDYSVTYGGVIYPLHDHIQALYDAGFTAGCSTEPLVYCPDNTLTRAESAVFMLRGLLGTGYAPPTDPSGYVFNDDWSSPTVSWGQPWAEGMWDEGLTAGCSTDPLLFCPATTFTRAEASVFGLRIENGAGYTPPVATHIFADDWSDPAISWAEAWAEQAYLHGLLPACGESGGKPLFCPSDLVTRAWAAYLVVEAKDLLVAP
jgi:hypothetical protein